MKETDDYLLNIREEVNKKKQELEQSCDRFKVKFKFFDTKSCLYAFLYRSQPTFFPVRFVANLHLKLKKWNKHMINLAKIFCYYTNQEPMIRL